MGYKLFSIITLATTLIACGSGSSAPDLPVPPKVVTNFITNGFDVQLYQRKKSTSLNADNFLRGEVYSVESPLTYRDVIIALDTQTESIQVTAYNATFQLFSLIKKAYALSPAPPETEEAIKSITITSAFDFNDEYPSGSSLNEFFLVINASIGNQFYTYNNDVRTYFNVNKFIEVNSKNDMAHVGFALDFVLNKEPHLTNNITFYIKIELDNGEIFSMETPEVTYKPTGQ
ncbi:hypothetical protein [Pseudoalteromonas luteoviolacea]|uniref:DUF4292 domain-containing protein n=1 Tax=Pseudoalteromonas luteoviolacea S4060-1 TaxID=1365257 RepID=A0A167PB71_9GAMM|nr:hypothetical protein [Pseudoalteromonas luteoviolacea]KZN69890.1 hypothetical protein N478_10360 [Pseudoalteromonas luteoviolacea S4060-1]